MIAPDVDLEALETWFQNVLALKNTRIRVLEHTVSAQQAVMEKYSAKQGSDAQVQTRKTSQRLKKRAKSQEPQAGNSDNDE